MPALFAILFFYLSHIIVTPTDVLQRAGVDYRKFHTLRHTFATRAFELAFDIPTLAEILGHAQKTTTENMYGHSLDDTKKSAMARFNRSAG